MRAGSNICLALLDRYQPPALTTPIAMTLPVNSLIGSASSPYRPRPRVSGDFLELSEGKSAGRADAYPLCFSTFMIMNDILAANKL